MTGSEPPSARELTRRLTAREASAAGAANNATAAAQAACERVYRRLSLWLGTNGAHALFARAFAQARGEHSALRDIHLDSKSESKLEGVTDSIQTHGARAVGAGLEAVLEDVLELLGRLLGPDIATRLAEQGTPEDSETKRS